MGASTPCVGICQARDGVCVGCKRTLAEIAAWPELSEAERLRIMREELPRRQGKEPAWDCAPGRERP